MLTSFFCAQYLIVSLDNAHYKNLVLFISMSSWSTRSVIMLALNPHLENQKLDVLFAEKLWDSILLPPINPLKWQLGPLSEQKLMEMKYPGGSSFKDRLGHCSGHSTVTGKKFQSLRCFFLSINLYSIVHIVNDYVNSLERDFQ